MVSSYLSRLEPLTTEEKEVWNSVLLNNQQNVALYGWSPAITALFAGSIALTFDMSRIHSSYAPDIAVLTEKDSPLHCLIDMIGLSRQLGERLMFHSDNSGYVPLQKGKRFRLLLADRFPQTRLLKFYRLLAEQCDRLLIGARDSDMVKLPDGQTPLEKINIFPTIREMPNTLRIPLR